MRDHLKKLPEKALKILHSIAHEAGTKKFFVYLVGGPVRDLLLNKKVIDMDILAEGNALTLAKALEKRLQGRLILYKEFGTASLILKDGFKIDFASARRERYPRPGALPVVEEGSLRDDLYRRDFTINAMAIDLSHGQWGKLIDSFDGFSDLEDGRIRVLHKNSFMDDPTRILRAVRFEQRLNFSIESNTLRCLKEAIEQRAFKNISPYRCLVEMKKILDEKNPLGCLKRLELLNSLKFLDEEFRLEGKILAKIHLALSKRQRKLPWLEKRWFLYVMALLKPTDQQLFERILKTFPWERDERESLRQCREIDTIARRLSEKHLAPSSSYQILNPLRKEVIIFLKLINTNPRIQKRLDSFLASLSKTKLKINGNDLKQLGIMTGEKIGEILKELLYLKMDKPLKTKREELIAARGIL